MILVIGTPNALFDSPLRCVKFLGHVYLFSSSLSSNISDRVTCILIQMSHDNI